MAPCHLKTILLFALYVSLDFVLCQDYRYWTSDTPLTWVNAKSYCENNRSQLASIHSKQDQKLAAELCQLLGDVQCWLGLNDRSVTGTYVWDDGSSSDYGFSDDDPTQPIFQVYPWCATCSDGGSNEPCIKMRRIADNSSWSDDGCGFSLYAICKTSTS